MKKQTIMVKIKITHRKQANNKKNKDFDITCNFFEFPNKIITRSY